MHVTKILFIGDSITASFGSKHFDENFIIENKAVSGDSTVETLSRIRKEWFEFKPDFISLCIGTNDFARFRSNDFIIAQTEKIISEIRKYSDSKIILTTIFPTRDNKPRPNNRIDKFNALLKINCEKWDTLFFDLNNLMKDETNQLKEEFTDDGLHLTESAYNLWKDELIKLIT